MLGQIHRIDVYVPDGDGYRKFNDEPLAVRITHNTLNTQLQGLNARDRGEALAARRLQYPATFDMPDNARVHWLNDPTAEGDVTIWNVQEGTESMWHGVGGANVVNTCQLERITNVG